MTNIKAVGFVTYNTLDISSGLHQQDDRKAFVIQNTKGRGVHRDGGRSMSVTEVGDEISQLWNELQKQLSGLDQVVVYVGAKGSERAIALAAQLPAEKVTFIGCRCGIAEKEKIVCAAGLGNAKRIICECGGHQTMQSMIQSFLATGQLFVPWED